MSYDALHPHLVPPIPILDGETEGEHISERVAGEAGAADSSIAVPVSLLATLQDESRREGLPHLLPDLLAARLNTKVRHALHRVTRIHTVERAFFRCQVEAHLRNGTVEFHVLDLTPKYVGTIIEALRQSIDETPSRPDSALTVESRTGRVKLTHGFPRWAGAVSYPTVAAHTREIAQAAPMQMRSADNPTRQVLSIIEGSMLSDAHVVRVDPEQVEVLPEWESDQEAIEYGVDAQLPFEPLYLDFEGIGGIAPRAGLDAWDNPLVLSGALLFRQGDDLLVVAPYGWSEGTKLSGQPDRDLQHESAGWFMFDRERLKDTEGNPMSIADKLMLLDPDGTGTSATTVATDYCIDAFLDPGEPQPDIETFPGCPAGRCSRSTGPCSICGRGTAPTPTWSSG